MKSAPPVMPIIQNIQTQFNPLYTNMLKLTISGRHRVTMALRGLNLPYCPHLGKGMHVLGGHEAWGCTGPAAGLVTVSHALQVALSCQLQQLSHDRQQASHLKSYANQQVVSENAMFSHDHQQYMQACHLKIKSAMIKSKGVVQYCVRPSSMYGRMRPMMT